MTEPALDFYGKGKREKAVAKLVFVAIFVRFKFDLKIQFNFFSFSDSFINLSRETWLLDLVTILNQMVFFF